MSDPTPETVEHGRNKLIILVRCWPQNLSLGLLA
jgi:hypothetical protein